MHPYISHLLEDILTAHRTEITEKETEQTLEEHFEEIDRWLSGEYEDPGFGDYCGLDPENFPPAEQLNEEEMRIVLIAFDKMMLTWNHKLILPENFPINRAYILMVSALSEPTTIPLKGFHHIDFCIYYAPDCELKEFCFCREIWYDKSEDHSDMNLDINKDELPF